MMAMNSNEGAFAAAFAHEINALNRQMWEEDMAALIAYAKGRTFWSPEDHIEAKRRVDHLTDKQLMEATRAAADREAKYCSECGREYES